MNAHVFAHPRQRPLPTARGRLRLLTFAAGVSFAQPFAAHAQTAPAPLPPAAQEALDKGIIAAKVPDYLLAIRYFEEARKLAPEAPVVLLNLGLAESRIPSRELRAIVWCAAYLAAYPGAPNAAAVKDQIAMLEVRNQSNVSRLIKTVQDAASQAAANSKGKNLCFVAKLWAEVGDIPAAVSAVDLIGTTTVTDDIYVCRERARDAIADARAAKAPTPHSQEPVKPWMWLEELDGEVFAPTDMVRTPHTAFLSAGPYVDLAGYLKSLPPSDDPQSVFRSLYDTAVELVSGQAHIHGRLQWHPIP